METISDRAFMHSGFCTEAEFAAPILKVTNCYPSRQYEQVFMYVDKLNYPV